MLDPDSDSSILVVLGLTLLSIAGSGTLVRSLMVRQPRRQLRRVERRADAGDPDAMRHAVTVGWDTV